MAIIWGGAWTPQLQTTFAAAADVLSRTYRLYWVAASDESHDLLGYDCVWAVGKRGGPADSVVRALTRDYTLARRLEQRRLWIYLDDGGGDDDDDDARRAPPSPRPLRPSNQTYDAVVYVSGDDRDYLKELGFRDAQLQRGYGLSLAPAGDDGEHVAKAATLILADARRLDDFSHGDGIVRAAERAEAPVAVAVVGETLKVSSARRLKKRLGPGVALHLIGNDACAQNGPLQRLMDGADVVALPFKGDDPADDWFAAFAANYAKAGATLSVGDPANTRLHGLLTEAAADAPWDGERYAAAVAWGVTRSLALGRGASSALLSAPAEGEVFVDEGLGVRRPSGILDSRSFERTTPAVSNAAKVIEDGLWLAEFGRARRLT